MYGIVVEYDFAGDETQWRQTIDTFISHINTDEKLKGHFSYLVNSRKDGSGRVHVGQWDSEDTLKHLQSQPFFGEFAAKIQELAGESMKTTFFERAASTEITSIG